MRARDLFYACGLQILSLKWSSPRRWSMESCFVLTNVQICMIHTVNRSTCFTKNTKRKGWRGKTVPARDLWDAIITSQVETGTPYMLYKDACNEKSNQKNLGTIRSSNLCTEIVEYTAPDEVAVCNLASIALLKFVNKESMSFSITKKLFDVTYHVTGNLNRCHRCQLLPCGRSTQFQHEAQTHWPRCTRISRYFCHAQDAF